MYEGGNLGAACMYKMSWCIKWEATWMCYSFPSMAGAWAGEWPFLLKCNLTCPARPLAGRRGGQCNQEPGQLFLEIYCLQIRKAVKVTTYLLEELWELYSTPFQALPKGYETANGCLLIVQGLGHVRHVGEQDSDTFLSPASGRGSSLWDSPHHPMWWPGTGPM